MASAQVKSSILFAGMYAEGTTTIVEPGVTRNHTERMLNGFGYPISTREGVISIQGGGNLRASEISVPADISSAAFFMVAASIVPGSDIILKGVGVNPTRTGVIEILRAMGADIELRDQRESSGEAFADIHVRYAGLNGVTIPESLVPLAIDEFPILFIAASVANGETVLHGAEELRVKESDRIRAMATGLKRLGAKARPLPDGIVIEGVARLQSGAVESYHDHRIAMAFAVAGLVADGPVKVMNCNNVDTSFPGFARQASSLGFPISITTDS